METKTASQVTLDQKQISDLLSNKSISFESLNININQNNDGLQKKPKEENHLKPDENDTKPSEEKTPKKEILKIPAKSRYLAAFLACTLGRFGIHKFYLKKPAQGVIYLFLSTTHISFTLGLLEGMIYLLTDKETWMKQVGYIEK
ncbi:TM2 domain-containing protein [Haloplasma contractile]|uniref:TM2 domain protein n=1 Tax=Haloplasma contractile SSD-17B TaxID=1033810 RepID=U2E8C0_9MOLU|nr:TM2 domain-containing protein [Haloplasma contractile]ERJ11136.1 TM2 domain protein [Haloplasma contractile SSD-17B]